MTEQSPAEAIFFAALAKASAEERLAFLSAACSADSNLRLRVERLLAAHPQVGSFLEQPAQGEAGVADAITVPPREKSPAGPGPGETGSFHREVESVGAVIVGKYKLLETLGEGGMGAVFMAQQTEPVKRLVALKLIKLGMDSRQVLARFGAERQALALMDHPNIAKVLDAGTSASGRPFFVMELVKGVPITHFCDERRLSTRERLELFIPVCQAIQHAHQKGVIHRDIKPSNVLIALYDDCPVPKVIDFGVAKAAGSQLTDASLVTGFGAVVGTPEYMSPEQAQLNQLDIDTRSDVYALGVLLYELLTGTTPIDRKRLGQDALFEILRVIREEEPPRPSMRLSTSEALASIAATRKIEPTKLTKLMRGELDWIVMKCLEKERARRYETANALARDLERYLHDEVIEARAPSTGYRVRKFVRRHKGRVAATAMFLALLFASVAVSSWLAVQAKRAEALADEKRIEAEANAKRADYNLGRLDQAREHAEGLVASLQVDLDLTEIRSDPRVGVLRLAETLRTIPEHAKDLREYTALNILAWGQRLHPIIGPLDHDGYGVNEALLSPNGLIVLTAGGDGTLRLWDSITGKQRATLDPLQKQKEPQPAVTRLQFGADGKTALTIAGSPPSSGSGVYNFSSDGDGRVVRLWDVGTGQLRSSTSERESGIVDCILSQDGSLLATSCVRMGRWTVYLWNASNGNLIRKLEFQASFGGARPIFDVSPDGKTVLIAHDGIQELFAPRDGSPPQRLPGNPVGDQQAVAFSPSGRSAVTIFADGVRWWNVADWQLQRTITEGSYYSHRFINDDILGVGLQFAGLVEPDVTSCKVFIRALSEPIVEDVPKGLDLRDLVGGITASSNGRLLVVGSHVYDARSGQRLRVPRRRKFHPELSQLTEDGRFTSPLDSYVLDLATDKKIDLGTWPGITEGRADARFLKNLQAWVALEADKQNILLLRKADAALNADLLQKWCQVITRGKLDESGEFIAFDEATWERSRLELAHLLAFDANALSLRSAVTDSLYWLRQEIKDSPTPLPLLDRLVVAEPTWPNYSQRASAHANLEHWDLAIRDELEAARLSGERYWRPGNSKVNDGNLGARVVQAPGRSREQYELALRWAEARRRAGVDEDPSRTTTIALALFRLGRYFDALAMLQKLDVPKLSFATGMLMSPWNVLHYCSPGVAGGLPGGLGGQIQPLGMQVFTFDPIDLIVRAMCYHRLGQPQKAGGCLQQVRRSLGKEGGVAEQRALLNEAEALIGGNDQP